MHQHLRVPALALSALLVLTACGPGRAARPLRPAPRPRRPPPLPRAAVAARCLAGQVACRRRGCLARRWRLAGRTGRLGHRPAQRRGAEPDRRRQHARRAALSEVVRRLQGHHERSGQLPADRLGRWHPGHPAADRGLGRERRANDQRSARGCQRRHALSHPDRARRGRLDLQHPGRHHFAQADRRRDRRHLPGQHQQVERRQADGRQSRAGERQPGHRHRASLRRLGHDLHLHRLPESESAPTSRARLAPAPR